MRSCVVVREAASLWLGRPDAVSHTPGSYASVGVCLACACSFLSSPFSSYCMPRMTTCKTNCCACYRLAFWIAFPHLLSPWCDVQSVAFPAKSSGAGEVRDRRAESEAVRRGFRQRLTLHSWQWTAMSSPPSTSNDSYTFRRNFLWINFVSSEQDFCT